MSVAVVVVAVVEEVEAFEVGDSNRSFRAFLLLLQVDHALTRTDSARNLHFDRMIRKESSFHCSVRIPTDSSFLAPVFPSLVPFRVNHSRPPTPTHSTVFHRLPELVVHSDLHPVVPVELENPVELREPLRLLDSPKLVAEAKPLTEVEVAGDSHY